LKRLDPYQPRIKPAWNTYQTAGQPSQNSVLTGDERGFKVKLNRRKVLCGVLINGFSDFVGIKIDYQISIWCKFFVLAGLRKELLEFVDGLGCPYAEFVPAVKVFMVVNHAVRECIQLLVCYCLVDGFIFLLLHPASEEGKQRKGYSEED